jgi:hypothetical protein
MKSWLLSALWTNRLGINMSIQRLSEVDFTTLENPGIRSVQIHETLHPRRPSRGGDRGL